MVEGRVRQFPLLWLVVVPSLEGGGAGGGGESHHLPHHGHVEFIPAQLCCIGTCCQDVRPGELRRAGTIVHKPAATTELVHWSTALSSAPSISLCSISPSVLSLQFC